MVKISIEVKEENKVTTYSADLTQAEKTIGNVSDKIGKFLKDTFKKETFTKETK